MTFLWHRRERFAKFLKTWGWLVLSYRYGRATLQVSATPSAPRSKQGTPHHARVRGGSPSNDLKTTTGCDTNRAVGTGRSVEKATGQAAPRALFLKGTFGFEMHLMV